MPSGDKSKLQICSNFHFSSAWSCIGASALERLGNVLTYQHRNHKFLPSYRSSCATRQEQILRNEREFGDLNNDERCLFYFCWLQNTKRKTKILLLVYNFLLFLLLSIFFLIYLIFSLKTAHKVKKKQQLRRVCMRVKMEKMLRNLKLKHSIVECVSKSEGEW